MGSVCAGLDGKFPRFRPQPHSATISLFGHSALIPSQQNSEWNGAVRLFVAITGFSFLEPISPLLHVHTLR